MNRLSVALTAALLLTGCATGSVPTTTSATSPAKFVTVQGAVKVNSPGYRLAAIIAPYTVADIVKIQVTLDGIDAGYIVGTNPGAADNTFFLKFNNLKADASYEVVLVAKNADGDTISDAATGCTTSFGTVEAPSENGSDDDFGHVTFNLKLSDQTFSGTGTGEINITPGEVNPTEASESVTDDVEATDTEEDNEASPPEA